MPVLDQVTERDPSSAGRVSERHSTTNLGRSARADDDELGSDVVTVTENDPFDPSAVHRSYGTLPSRLRILKNPSLAANIRRSLQRL